VIVTAPGSSANLGPGFDCLAVAVDLPFVLADSSPDEGDLLVAEPEHPAVVAHAAAGGDPTPLWWRSPIPPGRGLGFSGAARVAGAFLAGLQQGDGVVDARARALAVAADLEGHAENAAASAHGDFVVAAAGHTARLRFPDGVDLVVWSPSSRTSTTASRRSLPARVPLDDAVANVGAAAAWVAAVATGDLRGLRAASADRLHQPTRLEARPDVAVVFAELSARADVHAVWLSGSGPSVAALADSTLAPVVAASVALADGCSVRVLSVDRVGARIVDGPLET
jgi:homoserine kinase